MAAEKGSQLGSCVFPYLRNSGETFVDLPCLSHTVVSDFGLKSHEGTKEMLASRSWFAFPPSRSRVWTRLCYSLQFLFLWNCFCAQGTAPWSHIEPMALLRDQISFLPGTGSQVVLEFLTRAQGHQITAGETSMNQATRVAGFWFFSGLWESISGILTYSVREHWLSVSL